MKFPFKVDGSFKSKIRKCMYLVSGLSLFDDKRTQKEGKEDSLDISSSPRKLDTFLLSFRI